MYSGSLSRSALFMYTVIGIGLGLTDSCVVISFELVGRFSSNFQGYITGICL